MATFLGSDLKNIMSYEKKKKKMLFKLCFSLHIIPLDPDPRTQINVYPTGSGSRSTTLLATALIFYVVGRIFQIVVIMMGYILHKRVRQIITENKGFDEKKRGFDFFKAFDT